MVLCNKVASIGGIKKQIFIKSPIFLMSNVVLTGYQEQVGT
jgi:hypothetical protein